MLDAGIKPGYIVICQHAETARPDQIVIAIIRGAGSTLK